MWDINVTGGQESLAETRPNILLVFKKMFTYWNFSFGQDGLFTSVLLHIIRPKDSPVSS